MHVFDRRQLEQIRDQDPELERRFRQMIAGRPEGLDENGSFRPPADVMMGPAELVVVMELAGLRREDIRLSTGPDELVVQGRRRDPVELERERWLLMEIATGEFERRVALPPGLLLDQVAATYREGFLVVRIPRQEAAGVNWQEEDRP